MRAFGMVFAIWCCVWYSVCERDWYCVRVDTVLGIEFGAVSVSGFGPVFGPEFGVVPLVWSCRCGACEWVWCSDWE